MNTVRYLSVCSGIEAASCAWHDLGWTPVAFSEIEAFPSAVLAHHYPNVPNWGDMTRFKEWPDDSNVDVLVGGTPCQSFSVAGLRKGLADPRGNLALTYLAIAERYRPDWLVWENVPGVLSSDEGRDFGAFLGALGKLGYGFAYRVLDAQFFGVAQRRRRVFVVASARGWAAAAAVLFEPESLRGDSAPSRKSGQAAPTIPSRSSAGGGLGTDFDCDGGLIPGVAPTIGGGPPFSRPGNERVEHEAIVAYGGNDTRGPIDVATACNAHGGPAGRMDFESETFVATTLRGRDLSKGVDSDCTDTLVAFSGKDYGADADEHTAPTLRAMGHDGSHANAGGQVAVAVTSKGNGEAYESEVTNSLQSTGGGQAGQGYMAVREGTAVRRLTPRECERLQGFPDGYTNIPIKPRVYWPEGAAHCAKQIVRATIVGSDGKYYVGFNHVESPQGGCPRADMRTGEGYHLCVEVCQQPGHAEINALRCAGRAADGGRLYIEGHSYACEPCKAAAERAGITEIVFGAPPGNAKDGPRYKALGNSMAVPVMRWIGWRIAVVDALV